jgi:hypothetical protein
MSAPPPAGPSRLRFRAGGVMVAFVTPPLTWGLLAGSFVIGLAAVIRITGPAGGLDQPAGVIRLPRELTATIVTLFVLAALVFVAHVGRRAWSRRQPDEEGLGSGAIETRRVPAWLRAARQIVGLLYFVALAYLLSRGGITLDAIMALGAGAGAVGGGAAGSAPTPDAPALVTWSFGILALAAALGALGFALWLALGWRPATDEDDGLAAPPAALEAAVDESVDDLRAEPDARRAIVRCYARFERAAAASGVARAPWSTPMEFMREALRRLPIPRTAVPTLTRLFELARYSHHPLGPPERDQALAALDEIRTAMAAAETDGRARG